VSFYELVLALILQSSAAKTQPDAARIFESAHQASDIRSLGPFLLEARITVSGEKTLEGKYRLVYFSDQQWRADVVIGSDYLTEIQNSNTLYRKSKSYGVEDLLSPFLEIGEYATHFSDHRGASWKVKERNRSGEQLQCLRSKSSDWEQGYCFVNGLLVGDADKVKYSDFRDIQGKKYPFSWKKKTEELAYAGSVERIVKANIDPKLFETDTSFEAEPAKPCRVARVIAPRLMSQVPPQYPTIAKQARVQGGVVIRAVIDENGIVQNPTVLRGHSMLVEPAVTAVKQWRYEPSLCQGTAIPTTTTIRINFSLTGG
jgi:TonB family protein